MALKPETVARIQGILDGLIKVPPRETPADSSQLTPEMRESIVRGFFEEYSKIVADDFTPIDTPEEEDTLHMDEPDAQELSGADEIIEELAKAGHGDYSAFRRDIALEIYSNGHFAGNDTASFNPADFDPASKLPGFYVIQEDHYDQHMDHDEDKPEWDDMVAQVMNGYMWMS